VANEEKFEETKGVGVIRIRKSKDRQYNDQPNRKRIKGQTISKTTSDIVIFLYFFCKNVGQVAMYSFLWCVQFISELTKNLYFPVC
jgi:hypothetical protein